MVETQKKRSTGPSGKKLVCSEPRQAGETETMGLCRLCRFGSGLDRNKRNTPKQNETSQPLRSEGKCASQVGVCKYL